MVSVTSILGGNSDNTGSGIARRLGNFVTLLGVLKNYYFGSWFKILCLFFVVLKTGLNIIMACNIPKNSPMVEVCSLTLIHSFSAYSLRKVSLLLVSGFLAALCSRFFVRVDIICSVILIGTSWYRRRKEIILQ